MTKLWYAAQKKARHRAATRANAARTSHLRFWIALLIAWPVVVCFIPFQPLLVSIVGFRAAVFFLPVIHAALAGPIRLAQEPAPSPLIVQMSPSQIQNRRLKRTTPPS